MSKGKGRVRRRWVAKASVILPPGATVDDWRRVVAALENAFLYVPVYLRVRIRVDGQRQSWARRRPRVKG